MQWTSTLVLAVAGSSFADDALDFDRDIRPILSDRCFKCHGPDSKARQAGLRLDISQGAFAQRRGGGAAVVPGDPEASLLVQRISASDPDVRMPPPESNKTLSAREIALLHRWIEQGAQWEQHWAFRSPRGSTLPSVSDSSWPRNQIDHFVLDRLQDEGLKPSSEASRETLIRRVTFDLTGLPPTPEEIDAFLSDDAPDAYEKVVDRLLSSPRYGEQMAQAWLDLARYADTHGYHYDNERTMWPWRDWVISAYNRNLPFDQFTTEQLAGDLLSDATIDQKIATGFNRNHPISWEGGIIPEEYLVEYVVDRVNTTSTAWLGLTLGCARCHDHKFDPISQSEFYQLAAFFNAVPEKGADGLMGNAVPFIAAPDAQNEARLSELQESIERLETQYTAPRPELDGARAAWMDDQATAWRGAWTVLEPFSFKSEGGADLVRQDDGSIYAEGRHPDMETYEFIVFTDVYPIHAIRLEAMADERLPGGGPGRAAHSNVVLSEFQVEVAPLHDSTNVVPVEFSTAHADHSQYNFYVTRAIDGRRETGWALNGARYGEDRFAIFMPREPVGFEGGTALRVTLRQDSNYTQHAIGRVRLSVTEDEMLARKLTPSTYGDWHHVGPFLGDGGAAAHAKAWPPEQGVDLAADYGEGLQWKPRPELDDGAIHMLQGENASNYLHRIIEAPDARTITMSFGSDDAIKVWLNGDLLLQSPGPRSAAIDQNVVQASLRQGTNELLLKTTNYAGPTGFYFEPRDDHSVDAPLMVLSALNRPEEQRTAAQQEELRDFHLTKHSPEARALLAQLKTLRAQHAQVKAAIPTVMVMDQMTDPRKTHILMRGRYDLPMDEVVPGVPAVLSPLPEGAQANRAGFARWLVDGNNPLTARVAINRYWQRYFGRGLVDTPEDFGVQGSRPTHPALLDWMACRFVESDWDVKAMQRLIVTSATYRQDSKVTPELLERDPQNRLMARGARFRLSAETIRDTALAVSGLLVEKVGGPPVKPYQPEGLWVEVGSEIAQHSANLYERDTGDALYRRSMYTFWKRTLPPPSLQTFDAPTREYCVAIRSRTNTPLQALVLLNDPTYVEAARFLAQRMLVEVAESVNDADRLSLGFRLVTARLPSAQETVLLLELYRQQKAQFEADPEAVRQLLGVGDGLHAPELDRIDLAAWTMVASVLLNLDEAITKG
jgi:hypothetical protein